MSMRAIHMSMFGVVLFQTVGLAAVGDLVCGIPPETRSTAIQIVSATFGQIATLDPASRSTTLGPCPTNILTGNVTEAVRTGPNNCTGQQSCTYPIRMSAFGGDPAFGCWKQFSVTYTCGIGGPEKTVSIGGTARNEADGQSVQLDCAEGPASQTTDPAIPVTSAPYLKISDKGRVLEDDATTWSCVLDPKTGYLWESKESNGWGFRGNRNAYTWYDTNSATNGGSSGTQGVAPSQGPGTCGGVGIVDRCDTYSYTKALNATRLCGKSSGWRVPTVQELTTIAVPVNDSIFIDTNYFAFSVRADWLDLPGYNALPYWSTSLYDMNIALGVVFEKSRFILPGTQTQPVAKKNATHLRAVANCRTQ